MLRISDGISIVLETDCGVLGLYMFDANKNNCLLIWPSDCIFEEEVIIQTLEALPIQYPGMEKYNHYYLPKYWCKMCIARGEPGEEANHLIKVIKNKKLNGSNASKVDLIRSYPEVSDKTVRYNIGDELVTMFQKIVLKIMLDIAHKLGRITAINISKFYLRTPVELKNHKQDLEWSYDILELSDKKDIKDKISTGYATEGEEEIVVQSSSLQESWNICYRRALSVDLTYDKLGEILSYYLEKF